MVRKWSTGPISLSYTTPSSEYHHGDASPASSLTDLAPFFFFFEVERHAAAGGGLHGLLAALTAQLRGLLRTVSRAALLESEAIAVQAARELQPVGCGDGKGANRY
jgi:hypothetical protein